MNRIALHTSRVASLLHSVDSRTVRRVSAVLLSAMVQKRQVFLFGNGGSAATASHFAVDLGKGLQGHDGLRVKAHSLVDAVPTLTAWANDTDYSRVFEEQIVNFVQAGDVAIAFSGSGNSLNVLRGVTAAGKGGAFTVGFTGLRGGRLKDLVDLCVAVPSDNMQQIEDVHMVLAHAIYLDLYERLGRREPRARSGSGARNGVKAPLRPTVGA